MVSPMPPPSPPQHHLFQVNRHVQASMMLLSVMDGAELDLNNALLSSSKTTTTTTTTTSASDEYEKDLQLAAELGRCLLEQNQELQNYISLLQKQLDDKHCDMKLLHGKLESTREQLDVKCKQTEILDAANIDLERELAAQRRDNNRERQRIKELTDLCEKTRKQCVEIQHEYEAFRSKKLSSQFFLKRTNSPLQSPMISPSITKNLRRSQSLNLHSAPPTLPLNPSPGSNAFDVSSSIFKNHLSQLKSQITSLTNECATLNEQLHRSDNEKFYLTDRIKSLERQRRDDNDALQNEVTRCRKLLEKYSLDDSFSSTIYSPPEHDVSLYDEVHLEKTSRTLYEPTNYKELFARVYEKLKMSD